MLFQSQDDAVGNDGSENHPLKWSEEGQSRTHTSRYINPNKSLSQIKPDDAHAFKCLGVFINMTQRALPFTMLQQELLEFQRAKFNDLH